MYGGDLTLTFSVNLNGVKYRDIIELNLKVMDIIDKFKTVYTKPLLVIHTRTRYIFYTDIIVFNYLKFTQ